MWEEKGEKAEERQRSWEQKEHKEQKQSQSQEAKKVAVVNWWKARSLEGAKTRSKEQQPLQEFSETQAKLQRAEQTITDMREQVLCLQTSLRSAQECIAEKTPTKALCTDKATNTEKEPEGAVVERFKRDQRDAAVATETTGGAASEQEQTQPQVSEDSLLVTLRRMEAMVNSALETAELLRASEQRVSQVRVRMESITQKVEEALGRTSDTEQQLNVLEARITVQAPAQVCITVRVGQKCENSNIRNKPGK